MINFSSSSVVNFCELSGLFLSVAHSSRGLGHLPLKEEITGSNPVCATKLDFYSPHFYNMPVVSLLEKTASRGGARVAQW